MIRISGILFFYLPSVLWWHVASFFVSFLQPQYIINVFPFDVSLHFKLFFAFLGMRIRGLHFTEEPRNVQTLARWVCWPYLGRVPLFSPKCQVQPESKGCLVSLVCNIERRGWTELWVLCTTEDSLPMMQCKCGCAEADRRAVNEFAVIKPIYIHMCIVSLCSALSL